MTRQARECGDDRGGGTLALDSGFDQDDLRRGEAGRDGRDEVAASSRVGAGENPDGSWHARQPTLPLGGEESLSSEGALQLLQRKEVSAQADPLDRRRAKRELGLLLE